MYCSAPCCVSEYIGPIGWRVAGARIHPEIAGSNSALLLILLALPVKKNFMRKLLKRLSHRRYVKSPQLPLVRLFGPDSLVFRQISSRCVVCAFKENALTTKTASRVN